jgi:hypothetical protein
MLSSHWIGHFLLLGFFGFVSSLYFCALISRIYFCPVPLPYLILWVTDLVSCLVLLFHPSSENMESESLTQMVPVLKNNDWAPYQPRSIISPTAFCFGAREWCNKICSFVYNCFPNQIGGYWARINELVSIPCVRFWASQGRSANIFCLII